MSFEDLKAEDFMQTEPEKIQSDESLSALRDRMEKLRVRAIPVVNSKNQLQGVVGYRDLIRYIQFNPDSTKLEKVMHQPPEFDPEQSLVDLCSLRINSGRKMMVNTDKHNHLEAVVGDKEFAEAIKSSDDSSNVKASRICVRNLIEVFEKDSIEQARHLMLDNYVSRLPVLDKNGKLNGIVRSTDVLSTSIKRESMDAGGTKGGRQSEEVLTAGGGEKESLTDVPVSEITVPDVNTSEDFIDGEEALSKMLDTGNMEILFVEDNYPEAIVTLKDFIKHIAERAPSETMLVSLTGLELPEEKAAVHNAVKRQLQGSLGRKIDNPEELRIHIKKSEKDGKRHRYELNFALFTDYGRENVETEAWDLIDAVDEGLEKLNSVLRKAKEKQSDH